MKTIKNYNDQCRKALINRQAFKKLQAEGCYVRVKMTACFNAFFNDTDKQAVLEVIATFDSFTEDNDPFEEHDFIILSVQ